MHTGRRELLQAGVLAPWAGALATSKSVRVKGPVLVGSANGLPGMQRFYPELVGGADPLDVALEVVKLVEADPKDTSVGLGGLPNEEGVVQLDSACMHGPTHNSGAVAAIENILHPCEVARLVMERTDHCLVVGRGAYDFARMHGHPHTELLTEETRRIWVQWKESLSERDDYLSPAAVPAPGAESKGSAPGEGGGGAPKDEQQSSVLGPDGERVAIRDLFGSKRPTGTIHCSALSTTGEVGCTTTTSGLAWKIPGRVGDSPIVGAGLYCDAEAGSAGGTGRGEAAVLANASFALVELMRGGASPQDAGLEVLRRVTRQVQRQAQWQPALLGEGGVPNFNLRLYAVDLQGRYAGVSLRGGGKYSVADAEQGPRHAELVALHP